MSDALSHQRYEMVEEHIVLLVVVEELVFPESYRTVESSRGRNKKKSIFFWIFEKLDQAGQKHFQSHDNIAGMR